MFPQIINHMSENGKFCFLSRMQKYLFLKTIQKMHDNDIVYILEIFQIIRPN